MVSWWVHLTRKPAFPELVVKLVVLCIRYIEDVKTIPVDVAMAPGVFDSGKFLGLCFFY